MTLTEADIRRLIEAELFEHGGLEASVVTAAQAAFHRHMHALDELGEPVLGPVVGGALFARFLNDAGPMFEELRTRLIVSQAEDMLKPVVGWQLTDKGIEDVNEG